MAKNNLDRYRTVEDRGGEFNLRYFYSITLIYLLALIVYDDFLYFNNRKGGSDWKIGRSTIGVAITHQSRPLAENIVFAQDLFNRDLLLFLFSLVIFNLPFPSLSSYLKRLNHG